jgi:hypothetical protein
MSIAVVSLAGTPSLVWAQVPTAPPAARNDEPVDPKWNISGGYTYLYDGSWKEHLRLGFVASVTRRITPTISLVGEGGGNHGLYGDTGFTIQRYAFLGGMRIHGGEGEIRPFFQALVGYSRQGGDVGIANGLAVQPGGGADLKVNEWLTVRAQADYRFVREDGSNYNQYRFGGGIVWYLGKK